MGKRKKRKKDGEKGKESTFTSQYEMGKWKKRKRDGEREIEQAREGAPFLSLQFVVS